MYQKMAYYLIILRFGQCLKLFGVLLAVEIENSGNDENETNKESKGKGKTEESGRSGAAAKGRVKLKGGGVDSRPVGRGNGAINRLVAGIATDLATLLGKNIVGKEVKRLELEVAFGDGDFANSFKESIFLI